MILKRLRLGSRLAFAFGAVSLLLVVIAVVSLGALSRLHEASG